jgi:hypothetical protein
VLTDFHPKARLGTKINAMKINAKANFIEYDKGMKV